MLKHLCHIALAAVGLLPFAAAARVYTHDLGPVSASGPQVSHRFQIAASSKPVTILKAYPGCPCVKAEYQRTPFAAGRPIEVTFYLDPKGMKGHFTKSIYLRLSDNRRDTLRVTGTVTGETASPVSKYPAPFGMGLQLKNKTIDFGAAARGSHRTLTVPFVNAYQAGMMLDLRPEGPDAAMLFVPYGKKIGPGAESQFELRLAVPAGARRGPVRAWLRPVINGFAVDSIPVNAVVK